MLPAKLPSKQPGPAEPARQAATRRPEEPTSDLPSYGPLAEAEPLVTLQPEEPYEVAVAGGQHHVTARLVDGRMRLGVASEFRTVAQIATTLLEDDSLDDQTRGEVRAQAQLVAATENRLNRSRAAYDRWNDQVRVLRRLVKPETTSTFGAVYKSWNRKHPKYAEYLIKNAVLRTLWTDYLDEQQSAINLAKDSILLLWEIGKDFLPTHLMPVGAVFRDKTTFGGDQDRYTYHRGTQTDPIPITWYKSPADYPALRVPDGNGGTRAVAFGAAFTVGGQNFGLHADNVPRVGWLLQKTAHNESREGQQAINRLLNDQGVEAAKFNGNLVSQPLGATHGFDGDHVKDLGFGGADAANNYWPLNSRINRRAFAGYNAGYVVHYLDGTTPKSRSIGGLVGKWFRVARFLGRDADAIPADGAAAGGTPR